ncbi:unnamed protein product [Closterium sp. NIES-64]|nr:unnamed protein product [Closterium sp. NIES-64]
MAPKATRSFRGLLSQRSHMAKALPRRGLRPAKEVPPASRRSSHQSPSSTSFSRVAPLLTPALGLLVAIKVEERMASAGISSMGNGKAVRALLAIVAVIAACLLQPSQAAASVSVLVPIGTTMAINGRGLTFSSRRCVTFPAMPPSQTTRVVVPWKQASMTGKAVCRAIRFFQSPECKGQTLDVFANGRQRSALCLIEDLCQYARCPAGSDTCTPPTDDSAAVTCACKKGYSAVNNKCLPSSCPANAKCARRTGGPEMECKCKAGYNAVGGTCVPAAKSGTTTTPSGTTTTPSGTTSAPSGTSTATPSDANLQFPLSIGGHLTSLRKERRTHSQRADDFVSVTRQSSLEAVKEGAVRKQRLRVSVCGDRHTARCLCALEMDKSSNRVLPQARIVGASC